MFSGREKLESSAAEETSRAYISELGNASEEKKHQRLQLLCKGVNLQSRAAVFPLSQALVQSHLKCCIQLWAVFV